MARKRRAQSELPPFNTLPIQTRVAAIRYHLNWQGVALRLQYGRLKAQPLSLTNFVGFETMSGVVDMDFLVVVVRRIMRMVHQAKRSGLDTEGCLKPVVEDFERRWSHVVDARDTLEHIDQPRADRSLVPVRSSKGESIFLMPGKTIDLDQLFTDAEELCRAVGRVIRPYETEG